MKTVYAGNLSLGSEGGFSVKVSNRTWESAQHSYSNVVLYPPDLHIVHTGISGSEVDYCGGRVKVISITSERNVFCCSNCGLRIPYPADLKNLGELNIYLMSELEAFGELA